MSLPKRRDASLPPGLASRLNPVCDRFEAQWLAGAAPRLEEFLPLVDEADWPALLRELLELELHYRGRRGEHAGADEYRHRLPDYPDLISDAFSPQSLIQRDQELRRAAESATVLPDRPSSTQDESPNKQARQIRCPHCHHAIQLLDNRSDQVLCPGCGGGFRLREARGTSSTQAIPLGKFQLLERVGLGTFGAVWRAHDTELGRLVALKIPHAGLSISPTELERFHAEARKMAQLRHPNIVAVHEVPTLNDLPVIVSDFIAGVPLKDFVEVRPLTFAESANLVAEIAEALHYAHTHGLVHRDIKPANIMIESARDEGATGRGVGNPVILDFGLALHLEAQTTMTVDGQLIGTPAYMSPEQAAGHGHQADARSDVFGVGVILYELLCGELPFRGSGAMILHQVQMEDPRAPRRLKDKIPRDLETICLKAMAKEPNRRYQTAAEMATDLRRFLRGEPIQARPVAKLERLWLWCRRNPRTAALVGSVLTLLVLLACGSTVAAILIAKQHRRAERHFRNALDAVDQLTKSAEKFLADTPHMEDEQQAALEKALDIYQDLLQEKDTEPKMKEDLARVHYRLGNVWKRLGKFDKAKSNYAAAIHLFEDLKSPAFQAMCHNDLGELLKSTKATEAEDHFHKALALQHKLLQEHPDQAEHHQELARTCNNLGILLEDLDKGNPEQEYQKAVSHLSILTKDHPRNPEYQADLGRVYINLGVFLEGRRPRDAEQAYRDALTLLEYLRDNYPTKHDNLYKLAFAYNNLGKVLTENPGVPLLEREKIQCSVHVLFDPCKLAPCFGAVRYTLRRQEAEDRLRASIALFDRLAIDFPKYHLYRRGLGYAYFNLGNVQWDAKERQKAEEAWKSATTYWKALAALGDAHEYKSMYAVTLENVSLALRTNHVTRARMEKAREYLEEAIAQQQAARALNEKNALYRDRLAGHYRKLATTLLQLSPNDPEQSYQAAGLHARCVPLATNAKLAESRAAGAVALLRKAIAGGYAKAADFSKDSVFDPLRPFATYQELLAELTVKKIKKP